MRPVPFALGSRMPSRVRSGLDLPRATMTSLSGVRTWEFRTRLGVVRAPATAALAQALSGVRLGDLVVDGSNARSILDGITLMDQQATQAQAFAKAHPADVAPFGLAAQVTSWWKDRDATRQKVDQVQSAAQRAILLSTPQSAPDDAVAAYNGLSSRAADMTDTVGMVQAQLPQPLPGSGGVPAPVPGTQETTASWLGLPWWAWVLIGTGGIGLLAVLASSAAPSVPAVVVAGSRPA